MANAPTAHRRWRRLRTITATAATTAMMSLAACSGPNEGTINDKPTPTPSESQTPGLMFALDIPEDICPTPDVIPSELAAPESIGYEFIYGPRKNGNYRYQECTYYLNDKPASLDGTQAVEKIGLDFYTTDGSPLELINTSGFSSVDFEQVEAAEHFHPWDQVVGKSELDVSPTGKGLEESYYAEFEFFASIDNLYVYAYISFVVTDEDHNMEPDLDTEDAAYQILEAIVAPVVSELERQ